MLSKLFCFLITHNKIFNVYFLHRSIDTLFTTKKEKINQIETVIFFIPNIILFLKQTLFTFLNLCYLSISLKSAKKYSKCVIFFENKNLEQLQIVEKFSGDDYFQSLGMRVKAREGRVAFKKYFFECA